MSRTYRRKSDNGNCQLCWSTTTWDYDEDGVLRRIPLEGKELKKALAKYHSDYDYNSSPSFSWRQQNWAEFRAEAKREIGRYLKNEEHEVQIRANPRWPWWD